MSYALVGFNRTNNLSSEASTKYVLYGAISSGTMLFGLSLLYGLTGQMDLVGIQQALVTGSVPIEILSVVLLMVFAGFAFKISAFPLYMWTPDVYQGSPTPIAALLSVGPKAASIALLMRFILFGFSDLSSEGIMLLAGLDWPLVLSVMAAFTMTIGNLAALNQTSAKRLLAYSSIAQAGYLLMGFSVATESGFEAVLFYLLVYMAMNLGAFMVVALLYNRLNSDKIRGYSGLVWKEPFLAVMAAIFVFSLIGLPPFGGFVGKLYLFSAVVEKSLYWLAVVGVLNTVISVYYYIGLVRSMFLGKAEDGSRSEPMPLTVLQKSLLVLLAVPTLVLGVYWAPAKEFAKLAIEKTIW
jgi:NADH-quinone oxidoreductase subunit N